MMKALRGNLAILALAPALVMLALGIAVMRPAQAKSAFLKTGLLGLGAPQPVPHRDIDGMDFRIAVPDDGPATPAPAGRAAPCKIMLCTGIMGFPVQEPPLRTSIPAEILPRGPALVPEEVTARRDDPPPKPRSSIFS